MVAYRSFHSSTKTTYTTFRLIVSGGAMPALSLHCIDSGKLVYLASLSTWQTAGLRKPRSWRSLMKVAEKRPPQHRTGQLGESFKRGHSLLLFDPIAYFSFKTSPNLWHMGEALSLVCVVWLLCMVRPLGKHTGTRGSPPFNQPYMLL